MPVKSEQKFHTQLVNDVYKIFTFWHKIVASQLLIMLHLEFLT